MNSVAVYTVLIFILLLIVRSFIQYNDDMHHLLKRDIAITSITACVVLITSLLATLNEIGDPFTKKIMKFLIGLSIVGLIYFIFYLNKIDVNDFKYKTEFSEFVLWGLGLVFAVYVFRNR